MVQLSFLRQIQWSGLIENMSFRLISLGFLAVQSVLSVLGSEPKANHMLSKVTEPFAESKLPFSSVQL